MSGILHLLDQKRLIAPNGQNIGASIHFYTTGTLTPATIYSDAALTTPLANPVVVAAGGLVPAIYLDPTVTYRRRIVWDAGYLTPDDIDPYQPLSSGQVSFTQSGSGAVARTVQAKLRDTVAIADYISEAAALTAAGTKPVLYSDGSERLTDSTWSPAQTSGITGSVRPKKYGVIERSGGFGTYGAWLMELLVSAPSNGTSEFDVGTTSWVSHQNLSNNNQVFGAWAGANTPGSALDDFNGNPLASQTYVSGSAIGMEINVGNRWADFGLLVDTGNTRETVGLKIVPDVLPASDGVTPQIYHGTFGLNFAKSVNGHKWWTGVLFSEDAVMPAGIVQRFRNGSTLGNAPAFVQYFEGFYTRGVTFAGSFTEAIEISGTGTIGIDLSASTLTTGLLFGGAQTISWGGATISGGVKGITMSIGAGSTVTAADDFQVFVNNFGNRVIQAHYAGAAPRIGFLDAAPSPKITVAAAATDPATTQALTNEIRSALITFGLLQ